MKETGIVRRIDDLGRLVVPKEIRRAMKIKDDDPFEIFTDGESLIFKPFKPFNKPLSIEDFLNVHREELPIQTLTFLAYLNEFAKNNNLTFTATFTEEKET